MSYIEEFESALAGKLNAGEDTVSVVRWASEKMLQSYRNGISAGRKGKRENGKGENRQDGSSSEAK